MECQLNSLSEKHTISYRNKNTHTHTDSHTHKTQQHMHINNSRSPFPLSDLDHQNIHPLIIRTLEVFSISANRSLRETTCDLSMTDDKYFTIQIKKPEVGGEQVKHCENLVEFELIFVLSSNNPNIR